MKKVLIVIAFVGMITGLLYAQSPNCWKLIFSNKTLIAGNLQEHKSVALPSHKKGNLKLVFTADLHPAEVNRSFLFMDQKRKELFRVATIHNKNYALVSIDTLKKKTVSMPFNIYTIAIPTDSMVAMTIRVKPILLTSVSWQ